MKPPASILVVSPDATTLQGLTRALLPSGAPVAAALGWSEGRARLYRMPVSLVVADVVELGPDELAQVRRLRAEFPRLAVIALVALQTPEAWTAKTEGLVLAVLEKPIALGELEDAVGSVLSRQASS